MDAFAPPPSRDADMFDQLGLSARPSDQIAAVKSGLPVRTFRMVAAALDISDAALARLAGISSTTLTRRKRAGSLAPDESERVLRFARLLARAAEVFGTADLAADWLKAPNRALGHVAPLDYADTEVGAREVENLLGRIDYGVYS